MKPIKKGMTEAVTRDGRKVTQLTWFDVIGEQEVCGVVDGLVYCWNANGSYISSESDDDIFAPVEYEWQWLVKNQFNDQFHTTEFFKSEESLRNSTDKFNIFKWVIVSRIEESKREVQE